MRFADKSVFINESDASWLLRIAVLLGGVGVWALGAKVVSPYLSKLSAPLYEGVSPGVNTLLGHLVRYSLPTALLSLLALLLLHRLDTIRFPKVGENLGLAAKEGSIAGLAVVVLVTVVALGFGFSLQFKIGAWKMVGDLFSNAYEEIAYRGLILLSALYCFRSRWAALVFASLVFGWSHGQYPLAFQVVSGLAGAMMAIPYLRTGNLAAPWVAHQISDVVLDTILAPPG